ncbi:MAG: YraN family protein [Chloroflexi bacterium]|nr:YraN family protein [Chloroflexota bacterium]
MTARQVTGRRGEQLAADYLVAQGAELLERNFHVEYAEADLILRHEGDLVAVEVKCRDVGDFVPPEEVVRRAQLARIARALMTYAQDNDLLEMPMRIDVVLIVTEPNGDVLRFDHLKSIYPW